MDVGPDIAASVVSDSSMSAIAGLGRQADFDRRRKKKYVAYVVIIEQ